MEKIVNIFPAIIERNRRRVCQCEKRVFVVDEVNHMVYCQECGAIFDPWVVLHELAERWEDIEKTVAKEKESINSWREEKRKIIRFRGVQDITRNYKKGMWPICPECEQAFDPSKVARFVNAGYYGLEKQDDSE